MNKTRWIIFTIGTIGILALLVMISSGSKIDIESFDNSKIQTSNKQNGGIADNVFGKLDSKVTLIEYGDYQCPPCASVYPQVKLISEQYKDQVRFVFRNFPITTAHPNAKAAAATAEAAGLQGKFWEMHNIIYERQSDWSNLNGDDRTKFFKNLAVEIKLNRDLFDGDIIGNKVSNKINFDYALGKKAGVDATPTFFLNGKKIGSEIYSSAEKLKEAINTELKKAGVELPK